MGLLHHQFGDIFDRNNTFGLGNETGKRIQQRRFPASTAAGDDHIQAGPDAAAEQLKHRRSQGLICEQFVVAEDLSSKPPDR